VGQQQRNRSNAAAAAATNIFVVFFFFLVRRTLRFFFLAWGLGREKRICRESIDKPMDRTNGMRYYAL
jgi:hypothetical protein